MYSSYTICIIHAAALGSAGEGRRTGNQGACDNYSFIFSDYSILEFPDFLAIIPEKVYYSGSLHSVGYFNFSAYLRVKGSVRSFFCDSRFTCPSSLS